MLALTAWVFDAPDDAECAEGRLCAAVRARDVEVTDSAVVRWETGSHVPGIELRSQRHPDPLARPYFAFVLGVIFGLPLLGAAVGSPAGGSSALLSGAGLGQTFMNRVRDEVVPGTSALFVLLPSTRLADLRAALDDPRPEEVLTSQIADHEATAVLDLFGA